MNKHTYKAHLEWTGNKGSGTFDYRSYSRSHTISIEGKPLILGSSDASFRGEKSKHNPEDLFVSSISACHMLWYLHLCSDHGIVVLQYDDHAEGHMIVEKEGSGRFENITLSPTVVVSPESSTELAEKLHEKAHKMCFLANSCNFKIACEPVIKF